MIKNFIVLLMVITASGCTSVARVSNFENNSSQIDFSELAKTHDSSSDAIWNWKGKNEYFIYVQNMDRSELSSLLKKSVESSGYTIVKSSEDGSAIIGEKGIRLNEWGSVVGVYSSLKEDEFQVYIKVEITQDITGGWMENRAKRLGMHICSQINFCRMPNK